MSAVIDAPMAVHTSNSVQHATRDFAPYLDPCEFDEVRAVKTPERTSTHVPVPHDFVVDSVKAHLASSPMQVSREAHMLSHEGMRYWGVLELVRRED